MTVYSFKDTSGAFSHPLAGNFSFFGQIGLGRFTVSMATERTAHATASDGTVMVSAIAGDSGAVAVEVQQTSALHQFLLAWLNQCLTAMAGGDVSNFATAALSLRNITTNTYHTLQGISPGKMPDMPYTAQGESVVWTLMAADVQNG